MSLFILPLLSTGALAQAASPSGEAAKITRLQPAQLQGRKLRVTTTANMVTDLVRVVGGDRVEVTGLMGEGVDPHLYRASARDLQRINNADVVFYVGLYLEGKMDELLSKNPRAIAVSSAVPRNLLLMPEGGFDGEEGKYDPHIWFDPSVWRFAAYAVRDSLSRLDPAGRNVYTQNASRFVRELHALDAQIRTAVSRVPQSQRVLVTAHDAFGYYGRRYNIEVYGIQGISTVVEAGVGDITTVAQFMTNRRIPAIFVESSVPRRTVDAVISAARSRGHNVVVGGELFSDALGAEGTPEGTYLGMMRHNTRVIVEGLRQ